MQDARGEIHLLDRDLTSLCGSPYGWLTGAIDRCTCTTCLSLAHEAREARSQTRPGGQSGEPGH